MKVLEHLKRANNIERIVLESQLVNIAIQEAEVGPQVGVAGVIYGLGGEIRTHRLSCPRCQKINTIPLAASQIDLGPLRCAGNSRGLDAPGGADAGIAAARSRPGPA